MREEIDEEYEEKNLDALVHTLRAYDRNQEKENIPQGYTSVVIKLDAKPSSSLNWTSAIDTAEQYIDSGFQVVFEFDFGLCEHQFLPLSHHAQFQSLLLAVTQFISTIFEKIEEHIAAVIFFRGSLNIAQYISWDTTLCENFYDWIVEKGISVQLPPKESFRESDVAQELQLLFLSDVFAEYMELLAGPILHRVPSLLLFDAQKIDTPLLFTKMTNRSRYDRFFLAVTGAPIPLGQLVWEKGADTEGYIGTSLESYTKVRPSCGLVIPTHTTVQPTVYVRLEEAASCPSLYKIISEEFLTTSWEELDELIAPSSGLSQNGLRKLQGFAAAGGVVRPEMDTSLKL